MNGSAGIYANTDSSSSFSNITTTGNGGVGFSVYNSTNLTISDVTSTGNASHGIYTLIGGSGISFSRIVTTNNGGIGAVLQGGSGTSFSDLLTHSNGSYGVQLINYSNAQFQNTASYNNSNIGIYLASAARNVFTGLKSFNNLQNGIRIDGGISPASTGNSFSNIDVFNNAAYGMFLNSPVAGWSMTGTVLSNAAFHNNWIAGDGIYLNGTGANNMVFSDVFAYKNGSAPVAFMAGATGAKFYGTLKVFANSTTGVSGSNGNDAVLSPGSASDFPSAGFSNGTYLTGGTVMDCTWHSQPNLVASWGAGCGDYGRKTVGLTVPVTSSVFGSSLPNQKRPVRRNAATDQIEEYGTDGIDYDSTKKIGEW
jgi:hypothetical protein